MLPYYQPQLFQFGNLSAYCRVITTSTHRVEFGCELLHFTQTPHTVTAYVAGSTGEEVIIAHYLTGADGGKRYRHDHTSAYFCYRLY
ncbi:hypothetical protein E4Y60_15655 [Salmonella enterica]|nr:hypothetical protein [Salmonella enterica]